VSWRTTYGRNEYPTAAEGGPLNLVRLTDEEKDSIAPGLARRVAPLFSLVRLGVIRPPNTDEEQTAWGALSDAFPTYFERREGHWIAARARRRILIGYAETLRRVVVRAASVSIARQALRY
jgi:hypothetical protein